MAAVRGKKNRERCESCNSENEPDAWIYLSLGAYTTCSIELHFLHHSLSAYRRSFLNCSANPNLDLQDRVRVYGSDRTTAKP